MMKRCRCMHNRATFNINNHRFRSTSSNLSIIKAIASYIKGTSRKDRVRYVSSLPCLPHPSVYVIYPDELFSLKVLNWDFPAAASMLDFRADVAAMNPRVILLWNASCWSYETQRKLLKVNERLRQTRVAKSVSLFGPPHFQGMFVRVELSYF